MTARLTTRINGRRVLIQLCPNGVSGYTWFGEFRSNGGPVDISADHNPRVRYPVSWGPNSSAGLEKVLRDLTEQGQASTP